MSEKDINVFYVMIQPNDNFDEILKFLKKFFFKDEPLNASLDLGEPKELEIYCTKSLSEGHSFKAINETGEIIGIVINGIVYKKATEDNSTTKSTEEKLKNCSESDEKFARIIRLSNFVEQQCDIFNNYPQLDHYLEGKIISIDSNYRGRGIGVRLIEKTLDHMKSQKIPFIYVQCSSYFSARILMKLNFKEIYQLSYKDFKENGVQILNPPEPHDILRILVKEL